MPVSTLQYGWLLEQLNDINGTNNLWTPESKGDQKSGDLTVFWDRLI